MTALWVASGYFCVGMALALLAVRETKRLKTGGFFDLFIWLAFVFLWPLTIVAMMPYLRSHWRYFFGFR